MTGVLIVWPNTTILNGVDTPNVFGRKLDHGIDFSEYIKMELHRRGYRTSVSRVVKSVGNYGLIVTEFYEVTFPSTDDAVIAHLALSPELGEKDCKEWSWV